jgi:apolipoprotein N-acyltransferase
MMNFLSHIKFQPVLAGILSALAFFHFCPGLISAFLPIFSNSLLLFVWSQQGSKKEAKNSAKQAFFTGWLFGLVFFGLGISWVYVSIHDFGNVPIFESAGITLLFALFLGLFPAIHGYLLQRFFPFSKYPDSRNSTQMIWPYYLLAFPALGCCLELIRSWIFTGFPWLEIGTTQVKGPLAGFAPIFGSYGCTLLVYFIAGLLTYSIQCAQNAKNSVGPDLSKKDLLSDRALFKIVFPFILIFLILLIGHSLKNKRWTTLKGAPIFVSLIQGNIPQSLKWDDNNVINSLKTYYQETARLPNSRLIIWPETAIPLDQINAQEYLGMLKELLSKNNSSTALITGIPLALNGRSQKSDQYFNAAITLGNGSGTYQKHHLVPFGEYIPLHSIFGMVFDWLNVPMSDFTAGPDQQSLIQSNDLSIATFICYETAYSNYVRNQSKNSNLMIALSDDAWFGNSEGPDQHLQISEMRALENGRYFLNSTNNGITAVITPEGEILKEIPQFQTATLTTSIFKVSGQTPWQRMGLWPVWITLLFMLVTAKSLPSLLNVFRDLIRIKN